MSAGRLDPRSRWTAYWRLQRHDTGNACTSPKAFEGAAGALRQTGHEERRAFLVPERSCPTRSGLACIAVIGSILRLSFEANADWSASCDEWARRADNRRADSVWNRTDVDSVSEICQIKDNTGNSRGSCAVYRNPSANLSPTELASLRRVYSGLIHTVPRGHRDLFISMTFAAVDEKCGLVVTEIGERRLQCEGRVPWRGTPASNLLDLPMGRGRVGLARLPRAASKKPSKLVLDIVRAAHDMTKHRPIVWWVSVYEVTEQLEIHQDDKTVAAVQQAVDMRLLRANSIDDPGMVCVTYDGIRLVEKRVRKSWWMASDV